ncbi:hypothetical protein E2562_022401 [Oryza meyeriana var. granulata]|uniref:Uncharacterized protein n=1 Tax=Oryza meyeriana var. granulata TaxID=110450 RepID=A0A6G1EYC1_9ORYZ|nr:hypothetical protein E2562_022401 [Oryza meyeriana var. granulata]
MAAKWQRGHDQSKGRLVEEDRDGGLGKVNEAGDATSLERQSESASTVSSSWTATARRRGQQSSLSLCKAAQQYTATSLDLARAEPATSSIDSGDLALFPLPPVSVRTAACLSALQPPGAHT